MLRPPHLAHLRLSESTGVVVLEVRLLFLPVRRG